MKELGIKSQGEEPDLWTHQLLLPFVVYTKIVILVLTPLWFIGDTNIVPWYSCSSAFYDSLEAEVSYLLLNFSPTPLLIVIPVSSNVSEI